MTKRRLSCSRKLEFLRRVQSLFTSLTSHWSWECRSRAASQLALYHLSLLMIRNLEMAPGYASSYGSGPRVSGVAGRGGRGRVRGPRGLFFLWALGRFHQMALPRHLPAALTLLIGRCPRGRRFIIHDYVAAVNEVCNVPTAFSLHPSSSLPPFSLVHPHPTPLRKHLIDFSSTTAVIGF